MADADSMRPSAPRAPLSGGAVRLMGPDSRPGVPSLQPPQIQNPTNSPRPQALSVRRLDNKGNVMMGQGSLRPRPPSSYVPLSSAGQGPPRPQGAFSWTGPTGQQQNRPSNPYFGTPQARPFPRPLGGPGQPLFRPPFPQQLQQKPQQQSSHQSLLQQQPSHPSQTPQQQQRPLSAQKTPLRNNDDDDDVIMGQADTPSKFVTSQSSNLLSSSLKSDPVTPSQYGQRTTPVINEVDEFTATEKESTHIKLGSDYKKSTDRNINDETLQTDELASLGSPSMKFTNVHEIIAEENPDNLRKSAVISKDLKGDNDSGVDESTQEKERNGLASPNSPAKTPTGTFKTTSGISRPPSATPSNKSNKSRSASRSRLAIKTPEPDQPKKLPMNKVQVGNAPSPNLKVVRSKIGSFNNTAYRPGGGNVKIETKKIEVKASPRIEAKNEKYTPKGGDKKIVSNKLQWNAKSKIGSLENANHKPGGGDKKIDTIKTDFKENAKSKVASKDNVKHTPGGGDIKIQTHKIEIKAQSKVGSMDNVKHKPSGGDKKIFDDKEYLKHIDHSVALTPPSENPQASMTTSTSGADENLNQQQS